MNTQLIEHTDLIGFNSLTIANSGKEDFNSISLATQNKIIEGILGGKLFNEFSTDVDSNGGVPIIQKWVDFLNGVTYIDDDGKTHNIKGIKETCTYFVYREWLNQVPFVSNFTGKKTNNAENGEPLSRSSLNAECESRYNKGVDLYNNMVTYLEFKELDYVDAALTPKEKMYFGGLF